MRKGRSNASSSHDDYSLPRAKILRGRKNFSRLFQRDACVIRETRVDLRFQIVDNTSFGCQMGFIVKKSLGKATKRNRMRRLLKEAYRHHQHKLTGVLNELQVTLHGAFMAKSVGVSYEDVEQDVVMLIEHLCNKDPISGDSKS
ncbi:ribonuclease P protein component [Fodinibius salinus]|uniref:Ribonuclease P protein component n=1 Tax=Fodinibius salinus TaxID=860790 RepID=A0A5D3YHS4_9BACT|nr:ribonuclease P protein component [Fodinibius salinus]TYP93454.1 ribonuclease P protein component [Fodinibius salinus]